MQREPRAQVQPRQALVAAVPATTSRASPRSTSAPRSCCADQTVNDIIKEHFPVSIELGVSRVPLRHRRRHSARDARSAQSRTPSSTTRRCSSRTSATRYPASWSRRCSIYFFALKWRTHRPADERLDELGVQGSCPRSRSASRRWRYFARLVRGTMLETLQQDYVRTARAKGLRWRARRRPARAPELADPGRHRRRPAARLHHHRLVHRSSSSSPSRASASTTSPRSRAATTRS